MTKYKLTKEQRAEREQQLVVAIYLGLAATFEEQAKLCAYQAGELRKGLSATAIKRAERRARKLADEKPPGFVKAMESMGIYEIMCRKYRIPKADQDTIWGAVSQFCMFQLASRSGPFHDAACYFGMLAEVPKTCDCPNCRPRTAEELN